jgi:predicted site-specific integrase-resolvase
MTARELAGQLGVKPGTILDWHRRGKIPARKLSHKVLRFNLREVLTTMEGRVTAPGGEDDR